MHKLEIFIYITKNYSMPTQKRHFQPASRGDLSTALKSRKSLAIVAPQSPRPLEMLAGISVVKGADKLTSSDLALHELLISKAYEGDRSMSSTSYEIPLAACLRFLWSDARETDVIASLRRMEQVRLSFDGNEGRSFEGVQMLTSWTASRGTERAIGYQFPDPFHSLMRTMPSYGYIELAAIGQGSMRSKYSQMLYKRLAHEVSLRKWGEGRDNTFTLEFTPAELADLVGFTAPTKSLFSKLQERVISRLPMDFLGVRKFDLRIAYDGRPAPARGQGKSTSFIQLHVKIHPDTHHTVRSDTRPLQALGHQIGKPDCPRFRISSVFWLKVANTFKTLGLTHFTAHWTWLVALDEALEETPLTAGCEQRRYRGKELLAAIDANGAEAAAWCFFAEEAERGADLCNSLHMMKRLPQADRNRLKRIEEKNRTTERKTKRASDAKPGANLEAPPANAAVPHQTHPTFEQCTHIDLEIDPAATTTDLDDVIYDHLDKIVWNGSRKKALRAYFQLPGSIGVRQHFEFMIAPEDEDELIFELQTIGDWLTGSPTYRIEDKSI